MNVDRTTDRQTDRQTMKMKGKGGDDVVDLIILIFSSHSMTPTTALERKEVIQTISRRKVNKCWSSMAYMSVK